MLSVLRFVRVDSMHGTKNPFLGEREFDRFVSNAHAGRFLVGCRAVFFCENDYEKGSERAVILGAYHGMVAR